MSRLPSQAGPCRGCRLVRAVVVPVLAITVLISGFGTS